jgi:hypothetical protein
LLDLQESFLPLPAWEGLKSAESASFSLREESFFFLQSDLFPENRGREGFSKGGPVQAYKTSLMGLIKTDHSRSKNLPLFHRANVGFGSPFVSDFCHIHFFFLK